MVHSPVDAEREVAGIDPLIGANHEDGFERAVQAGQKGGVLVAHRKAARRALRELFPVEWLPGRRQRETMAACALSPVPPFGGREDRGRRHR